jgi:hypothetical protein
MMRCVKDNNETQTQINSWLGWLSLSLHANVITDEEMCPFADISPVYFQLSCSSTYDIWHSTKNYDTHK